jgi:hypothetical protein
MAETYCLMMKADKFLRRTEREARRHIGNDWSNEMIAPKKFKADLPEPELPDEEAWEKERKTALAQIQNASKFCF